MRSFWISFVFLFSFVVFSFGNMVPYTNGSYIFESLDYEKVGFVVNGRVMNMVTEDGTVVTLNLVNDVKNNSYYFYSSGEKWMFVFFDDACYGALVTSDSRYGSYTFSEIYDAIVSSRVREEGVFILRNIHPLCNQ